MEQARRCRRARCRAWDDEGGLSPAVLEASFLIWRSSHRKVNTWLIVSRDILMVVTFSDGTSDVPFDRRELDDLPRVFSEPRFATYLRVTANDRERALALYEWNLRISAAFVVPLQVCEVATRNGVAEAIVKVHGENWPWSNGFRRSLPRPKRERDYDPGRDLASVALHQPTAGKVVAELRFAFWERLFTVGQDQRLWEPHFREVFPGAPDGLTIPEARAKAFDDLQAIRKFRNRIAHHEPIFTRTLHTDHRRIMEMIGWRSPAAVDWVDRIQDVTRLIPEIPDLD